MWLILNYIILTLYLNIIYLFFPYYYNCNFFSIICVFSIFVFFFVFISRNYYIYSHNCNIISPYITIGFLPIFASFLFMWLYILSLYLCFSQLWLISHYILISQLLFLFSEMKIGFHNDIQKCIGILKRWLCSCQLQSLHALWPV